MKTNNVFIKIKDISFIELLISALLIEFIVLFFLFFSSKVQEIVRDSIRKREVSQIGRIITNPCFIPNQIANKREYDLSLILKEIGEKDDIYQSTVSQRIKDPQTGTEKISMYIYKISENGQECSLYANLESPFNKETLEITDPTPGEGIGILKSTADGWNGSPFYFQYSNQLK